LLQVLKVIPKKSKENKKMGAPKKSSARVSEDHDELVRVPLQAILLADSFTTKFRPITLERPKVI
jgi:translation initiation factor eIF-2B subunit epsilon